MQACTHLKAGSACIHFKKGSAAVEHSQCPWWCGTNLLCTSDSVASLRALCILVLCNRPWQLNGVMETATQNTAPSVCACLQGLRTLVLGTKILTEDEWSDWDGRYQDAAAQLDNRDEALAALAVEIEANLEMVGVTAIEDKLQEGVPAAIQSLLDAGMKVCLCFASLLLVMFSCEQYWNKQWNT